MTIFVKPTRWVDSEKNLRPIRERVFIDEQHVPLSDEWDGKDENAIHFIVQNNQGEDLGCARLLQEESKLLHIGRVAVLKAFRNQGVGRQLMHAVINYCRTEFPNHKIYLHAQTQRQEFYEHLGFIASGPVFMDAGIPHIEMWFDTP